jgi:hypothetical protein
MLPIFIAAEHIDDNWFYNYDTHGWHKLGPEDIEGIEPDADANEPAELVPEGPSAPVASTPLVQGKDRTATQIREDMKESFKHGPDPSKIFEPLVDQTLEVLRRRI